MVNLAEIQRMTTAQAIASHTEESEHRPYLGASALGHSCERFLWYSFRWCYTETFSERQMRLFGRGHREEPVIVEMLAKVGIKFWGDQDEISFAHGHCKGHRDGAVIGVLEAPKTEHLAEFKTMNKANFSTLCKQGVFASKPGYYSQSQVYMKYFKLTRCLFVVVCKDNDAIYIERIKYDADYANALVRRAEDIILSETPPEKRFDPTWYECKWCAANKICHGSDTPLQNCRTCKSIDMYPDGLWKCQKHGDMILATGQQRLGCDEYQMLECL